MTYQLFLDDERFPASGEWRIARSYLEAVALMEAFGCPSKISFDHDLGEGPSGFDVAQWLIASDLNDPTFIPESFTFTVHSMNPVGARNIQLLMDRYLVFKRKGE